MIQFNTNSWHYRIVMYVFGDSFFTVKELDLQKSIKQLGAIYTKTPKIVNFCPYCRAVVMGIILFPFAFIVKLFPKRKKKAFDIKKSRRNTKIIRIVAMIGISLFGVHQLYVGNYGLAIFHFSVASFQIWGKYVFDWYRKYYEKKLAKKPKQTVVVTKKNPSLIMTYLYTNHNKVCPPIAFVDENDTEVRV